MLLVGCSKTIELESLKNENNQLKMQNEDYKNRLSKYETVKSSEGGKSQSGAPFEQPPVTLKKIEFDKSGVTAVEVIFENNTSKNIDAIEFVILQFDSFGRPAYIFEDKSLGNVTGELLLQGNAKPGGTLRGGWKMYNTENTVKGKVVVKQIHFTDDSVWKNLRFEEQVKKEQGAFK